VPPSTKATSNRGKKLLFSPSPPAVEIKGKRPFTRSSIPKEDFREQSLPEIPIQKKKGKNIEKPVLATFLVFGIEIHRSVGYPRSTQA
jgi:hypothetical protein